MLLPLLALLVPAVAGAEQTSDGPPVIIASGSQTLRVPADRAYVFFLVEGTGETSALALQRLSEKVRVVREVIVGGGIAVGEPMTFTYGVAPPASGSSNQWPGNVVPQTARAVLRVQLTRLEQFTVLVSSALLAGASATSPPQYEFSAADSLRRTLIPLALQKARRDAELLATGMNATLGEPLQVTAHAAGGSSPYPSFITFTGRHDVSGQLPQQEVAVTANVNVHYRFTIRR